MGWDRRRPGHGDQADPRGVHRLPAGVPALVILVDVGGWYGVFAAVIWLTVAVGVIAFFDYGLSYSWLDTVPGFLISNWYLLLMLALLVLLPVRERAATRTTA